MSQRAENIWLLILVGFALFSCGRGVETYASLDIVVHNEFSELAVLQGVEVIVNDAVVGYTDAEGKFILNDVLSTDSIRLEDPDFTFFREKFWTSSPQFSYRFYARKNQSPKDSLAISFLKSLQNPMGIMPSIEGGNLVSTYDQALAVIAFCATGQKVEAERILDYFESQRTVELEQGLGGFYQFRSPTGTPTGNRWMGDNAWLAIAVMNYHGTFPASMPKYGTLQASLQNWLASLKDPYGEGLYGGYLPNGDTIHKITEGNIDALAVFDDHGTGNDIRTSILKHLGEEKWDSVDGNLMAWPTNAAYKYALDCNTWAYCAIAGYPESARTELDKFELTATSAITGENIAGYCFDEDRDVLWYEGTGQVAVTHWVAGDADAARAVLQELEKGWVATAGGQFGLPYSANHGTGYGADPLWSTASTDPCISSTAWYLLASYRYNPMVWAKQKTLDPSVVFW